MAKQLLFSDKARKKLLGGIKILAKAVESTMGPKGRNVILDKKFGVPTITNDGVTIAKEIELPDPFENMGAELVKEVASKTNDIAGDGTTTATVLAYHMIMQGIERQDEGSNTMMLKKGIDKAVSVVIEELEKMAKKVTTKEEIEQVATISAQNPDVGKLISEVMEMVGKDGVITVEEGQTMGLSKEVVEGMQFDSGYISPYMVTDTSHMESVFEDPYILITDKKISSIQDILPLLENMAKTGKKDLVIIAEDVEGEALATLVVNKLRGTFNTLAVKAPAFGDRRKEMLKDIAVLTGGKVISEEIGMKLENVNIEDLGQARKIISDKDNTTIVEGKGEKKEIEGRIAEIKIELENTDSDFDKEKLQERLAKLTGGVAVIKVGAATEVELKEKKHRIEDALSATRAAVEEGIVAGGGTALIRCIGPLEKILKDTALTEDEKQGIEIVKQALKWPLTQIAVNAGQAGETVVEKVYAKHKGNEGYNAETGEIENLVAKGIIDPKKVTRSALQNAASVAGMFLTMETAITDIPEKEKESPGGMPPGGMPPGGMPGMGM